jgi:hypothetical protein
LVLQNNDEDTVYHCEVGGFYDRWIKDFIKKHFYILETCFKYFDQDKYNKYKIDLFALKNKEGLTISDLACQIIRI